MIKELEFYKITKENYSKKELVLEYAKRLYPERTPQIKKVITNFLDYLKKDDNILDFGSGTGKDVNFFIKMGYHATGYDYSEAMVNHSIKEFGKYFFVNDLLKPLFIRERFNAIFSLALIQHILEKDLIQCLDNFDNLLVEDGIICIITKRGIGTEWDTRLGSEFKRGISFYSISNFINYFENKNYTILYSNEFSLLRENMTDNWLSIIVRKSKM